MAKENKVSFRLDDDIMEILMKCDGENNNQKFENLVRECFQRLPDVRKQVKAEQKSLADIRGKIADARAELSNLSQLRMYQTNMYTKYQEFIKAMERLAEGAEKLM